MIPAPSSGYPHFESARAERGAIVYEPPSSNPKNGGACCATFWVVGCPHNGHTRIAEAEACARLTRLA